MLLEGKVYIFKKDKKSYRLHKDSGKDGWYFTKPYDDQIESLLFTENQMRKFLEEQFEECR
jgi:hypothetical protein